MSAGVLRVLVAQTGIYEFKIGMAVEVDYVNPTGGWVSIWLEDILGNVVLNFSCRITEKVLVLNTLQGGKWGIEERPCGYNFTAGACQSVSFVTKLNVDYFSIVVNGVELHQYKFRLPATLIKSVVVNFKPSGCAEPPTLKAISYKYSQ